MQLEGVIEAITDTELAQAWASMLSEFLIASQSVAAAGFRCVLNQDPVLSVTLVNGPKKQELRNILANPGTSSTRIGGRRVMPREGAGTGVELADVPAGFYAVGFDSQDVKLTIDELAQQTVRTALRHTYTVLKTRFALMKDQTVFDDDGAVFLVDALGQVYARNEHAAQLLKEPGGPVWQSASNVLMVRGERAETEFHEALKAFFARNRDVHREMVNKKMIATIRRAGAAFAFGRLATVSFRKIDKPVMLEEKELIRVLGLTPAQARLAKALVSGLSLEQCAEVLGISRRGARFHLHGVFRRMNCHTQAGIVRDLIRCFG